VLVAELFNRLTARGNHALQALNYFNRRLQKLISCIVHLQGAAHGLYFQLLLWGARVFLLYCGADVDIVVLYPVLDYFALNLNAVLLWRGL